ncbi:MAG: HIT domain-containing protein [Xanthobacteraceae bacterium]|nr:HIT domain-containing protein [Xanthobacteraceae bacterium]MBX3549344.1 HIT domain-containing protein [Xanthobacteraceae bacterium]MCW5678923.1 HIT domain-containing protein [Xanthobacteraceae bacterium]
MTKEISLDPRLAADSIAIGKLALCEVRLQDDARFPWLVLVPQRENVSELFELAEPDQAAAMEEIARVSAALRAVTQCLKINVGALGNIVRQLHIHIVARNEGDAAWPGPVWGAGTRVPYDDVQKADLIERLRSALAMQG